MLNLKRVFKNYEEAGSLNAMVNLFGFIGHEVFLTKSGDAGIVLEFDGVDYECLDMSAVDALTKRLESALRLFDENYRVYQLLFKRNQQDIPHSFCGKPVVDAAIRDRVAYLREKASSLFSLSIYFVVLCPALAARRSLSSTLMEIPENPRKAIARLRARFSATLSQTESSMSFSNVVFESSTESHAFPIGWTAKIGGRYAGKFRVRNTVMGSSWTLGPPTALNQTAWPLVSKRIRLNVGLAFN
jgi:hypothetical protein